MNSLDYSQPSDYSVRLQLCRLIRAKWGSLWMNHYVFVDFKDNHTHEVCNRRLSFATALPHAKLFCFLSNKFKTNQVFFNYMRKSKPKHLGSTGSTLQTEIIGGFRGGGKGATAPPHFFSCIFEVFIRGGRVGVSAPSF